MWEILHAAGIRPAPRRAKPTCREFLAAQAHAVIACDFLVVETVRKRLHLGGLNQGTTRAQLAMEERLVAQAGAADAPRLTRAGAARALGTELAGLEDTLARRA